MSCPLALTSLNHHFCPVCHCLVPQASSLRTEGGRRKVQREIVLRKCSSPTSTNTASSQPVCIPPPTAAPCLGAVMLPALSCSPGLTPVTQCQVTFHLGCFRRAERKDTVLCFPNALKSYSLHPYFSSPEVEHSNEVPVTSLCLCRPCASTASPSFHGWSICLPPPADPAHPSPSETLRNEIIQSSL